MRLRKRGQYSFEFVIIVGAVLALLTISSFFVFRNTLETKAQVSQERTRVIAEQIISTAEQVNRLGEGGFKVVELEMPPGIESINSQRIGSGSSQEYILNFTFVDGSSAIYFSDVYIYATE